MTSVISMSASNLDHIRQTSYLHVKTGFRCYLIVDFGEWLPYQVEGNVIKGKDKIRLAEALAFFNPIEVDQSQSYVSFKLKSQSSFISSVHI